MGVDIVGGIVWSNEFMSKKSNALGSKCDSDGDSIVVVGVPGMLVSGDEPA